MTIATAILTIVHLIMAVALIFLILLHSGKGGLGDMFGGGMQAGGMGGSTLAERNLDRITVVVAVLFGLTTISLAILLGR
ncbi:MAG: preprotein translocase subunit SecG [bacterium]|nr:preprotein translocase subunit SecG [bacterium]MDE0290510.1 preprotein translocase subunit SecG [bacterium]MDE0436908.1 preprotein translocase subunit SecG [bacterium]